MTKSERHPEPATDLGTRAIARNHRLEDLPEFLSPEEFRQYMGLGRATVYELLRRGEIPQVRFGRCIRIPKAALAKLTLQLP